jgi:hypothetical protein
MQLRTELCVLMMICLLVDSVTGSQGRLRILREALIVHVVEISLVMMRL